MIFDQTISEIDRGRSGLNEGIPIKFERLNIHIPNIQQKTYYLIGGETSAGKTAFADDIFMYDPIEWYLKNKENTNIKLHIKYFSFEINKIRKITKLIAKRIYNKYKILVDVNYVLSRGKNRIADEIYELVVDEKEFFYRMEEYIDIIDTPINPTGVNKIMRTYLDTVGKDEVSGYNKIYHPHDPNLHIIMIIDHIALSSLEQGFTKKQNIDKLSEYCITLRNRYSVIPVLVQQLNRDMSSSDRFKLNRVEPQLSDFKDSGCTQEDADTVIALFNPSRYELPSFHRYDVTRLRKYLRTCHILKNRDGEADIMTGMGFIGEIGLFFELPRGSEMTQDVYKKIEDFSKRNNQLSLKL